MFYIGIDIAKHNHEASIIDSDGSLLCESISFSNSQKGCEKLIALLERFSVDPDNCIVGMEATGHYWLSIDVYKRQGRRRSPGIIPRIRSARIISVSRF